VHFYTAANFLGYGNNLQLVRTVGDAARNAVASGTAVAIKNQDVYDASYANGEGSVGPVAAKYPGAVGNSLKISICDAANFSGWDYEAQFDGAPSTSTYAASKGASNDEVHVIVVDEDGAFTGVAGTVLEKFPFLSVASDAKSSDGGSIYYKNVLNNQSKYVWWMDHPTQAADEDLAWGAAASAGVYHTLADATDNSLSGGVDAAPSDGNVQTGYDLFANKELVDVSLLLTG